MRNPTHPLTTIEEIEQAALEIFAERGFDDPTVEEIAAAAGISRRTFFRYFPAKADIPWGNFEALLRNMDAWYASAPDDRPIFDVIAEGTLRFNRVHAEGKVAHRERMTLIMRTPALVANAALRHSEWSAVIARYAARRLDEPPDALAPQLVAHIALGCVERRLQRVAPRREQRPRRPHQPGLRHGAVRTRGAERAARHIPAAVAQGLDGTALRRAPPVVRTVTDSASLLFPAAMR